MAQASIPKEGEARSVAAQNRRASIRYRCAPATIGKVISTHDQEFQRAWILDLSLKGMGMQLARPLVPGHLIIVTMKDNAGRKTFELTGHVAFCASLHHGDWHVGCEFTTQLTVEELDQLL